MRPNSYGEGGGIFIIMCIDIDMCIDTYMLYMYVIYMYEFLECSCSSEWT
jgi:hypothetical protein